jgi:hypothetical protein
VALFGDAAAASSPGQSLQVPSFELATLIARAEHLLWILARQDVENLSGQRQYILRELQSLERRAAQFPISSLYQEAVQTAEKTR